MSDSTSEQASKRRSGQKSRQASKGASEGVRVRYGRAAGGGGRDLYVMYLCVRRTNNVHAITRVRPSYHLQPAIAGPHSPGCRLAPTRSHSAGSRPLSRSQRTSSASASASVAPVSSPRRKSEALTSRPMPGPS